MQYDGIRTQCIRYITIVVIFILTVVTVYNGINTIHGSRKTLQILRNSNVIFPFQLKALT